MDIKSNYYHLGRELGVPPSELDTIRKTFHQDMEQALNEVLLVWLRQRYNVERFGPPTWWRLVEAVDSSAGGGTALAMAIASKHPVAGMTTVSVQCSVCVCVCVCVCV